MRDEVQSPQTALATGRPPARASRSRWKARGIALAGGTVVALVLLEVGIRVLVPQAPSWLDLYVRHPRLPFHALAPGRHSLVETDESRWEVYTDESGFRIGRHPLPATGKPVALWLGDSFAFGQGVDFEASWIGLLQSAPGAHPPFVDAAVGGYGPPQYAAVLDDALDQGMAVKMVFVATFVGNDFYDSVWDKDEPIRNGVIGDDGGVRSFLKRNFHTYRLLGGLYRRLAGKAPLELPDLHDFGDPEEWRTGTLAACERAYRAAFLRIASTCARRELPLVVLVLPSMSMAEATRLHGEADLHEVRDSRAALGRARDILASLGIRYVDATNALAQHPTTEMYFPLDQHLTPAGHRVVADLLRASVPELR